MTDQAKEILATLMRRVIEAKYEERKVQKTLERILELNPNIKLPTPEEIDHIKNEAVWYVQKQFPDLNLKRKVS